MYYVADFQSKRLDRRAKVYNKVLQRLKPVKLTTTIRKKKSRCVRIITVFEYFVVRKKSLSSLIQTVMTRQVCLTTQKFGKTHLQFVKIDLQRY